MGVLQAIWDAAYTGAGFFWKAFWALGLGYAISAGIQVFVSRREAAEHLGTPRPKPVGLAMGMGFASSSCSFAALSATRSLYTKGAHLIPALAFMFASTNLAVEVAALAWIFLGWQYVLALFAGAPILVAVMAGLVRLTKPERLADAAREHARDVEGHQAEPSQGLPEKFTDRFRSAEAWHRVGRSYRMEWGMVWRDLLIGFAVAGAVAALVPAAFFEAIFPTGWPTWLELPAQALMAPVLAVLTVIGSMGNGPVAAVLAGHGVVFGAIMAFLYADFVVPPALRINARYYGWRFAGYLALVFTTSAVLAGIIVHVLFGLLGLLPEKAKPATEMASFALDYTFWLNLLTLAVGATLIILGRRARRAARRNPHPDPARR